MLPRLAENAPDGIDSRLYNDAAGFLGDARFAILEQVAGEHADNVFVTLDDTLGDQLTDPCKRSS